MNAVVVLSLASFLAGGEPVGSNVQHGLRVPPGFEVVEYADSKLADDIYCMTLDPQGRVIVSDTQRNRLQIYNKVKNYTTAARTI